MNFSKYLTFSRFLFLKMAFRIITDASLAGDASVVGLTSCH